ncbi:hypothetical protein B0H11DRAFT_1036266 [Mycena galericulata]|nr:hypothetical protein B0H11DRAFT_1036266 [Mycena galericulata]
MVSCGRRRGASYSSIYHSWDHPEEPFWNSVGMSSSMGDLGYSEFVWDHWIYRAIFLSGLVILVYDHFLTFASEVEIIWSSKLRLSSSWFLVVRYFCLACYAVMMVFYFGNLNPELRHVSKGAGAPRAITRVPRGSDPLHPSLFDVCLQSMGPCRLSCDRGCHGLPWNLDHNRIRPSEDAHGAGNDRLPHRDTKIHARLAGAWEAQLAIDLLRMAHDGVMYFGIIVLANLANVLTLFLGDVLIAGILSWWTTSLSVTLITRLMLNLHRAQVGNSRTVDDGTTQLEEIHFVGQDAPHRRGAEDDFLRSLDDV